MLGILMMLGNALTRFAKASSDAAENEERRKHPFGDGTCYIDNKGVTRLVSNNRPVLAGFYNEDGQEIIKDLHTGVVYKNLTLERTRQERKENIENQKKYGGSTICLGLENNYAHAKNQPKGARFKDVKTGKLYVIRKLISYGYCYYDIDTGQMVRRTDYQKLMDWLSYEIPKDGDSEIIVRTGPHTKTVEEYNKKMASDGINWESWDAMGDYHESKCLAGGYIEMAKRCEEHARKCEEIKRKREEEHRKEVEEIKRIREEANNRLRMKREGEK